MVPASHKKLNEFNECQETSCSFFYVVDVVVGAVEEKHLKIKNSFMIITSHNCLRRERAYSKEEKFAILTAPTV